MLDILWFGHMYNDIYPLLYHTEYFHCPRDPLCSVYSDAALHPPVAPEISDFLTFSIICFFLEYQTVEIIQYVAFSDQLFQLVTCIEVSSEAWKLIPFQCSEFKIDPWILPTLLDIFGF